MAVQGERAAGGDGPARAHEEPRIFGTDGIRGRAGEGWLAADRAAVLARSVATVLARGAAGGQGHGAPRALIGHDGRRSGPVLLEAIARGMSAAGYAVSSAGLITTPGLAVLTREGDYGVGVMISASHNPAHDNGIKIFDADGGKLDDALEDAIQRDVLSRAAAPLPADVRVPADLHSAEADLEQRYVEHLLAVARGLDLRGVSVALDCANGGGSHVAPRVLAALGAELILIATEPDGDNINAGCGSTYPATLQAAVRAAGADLGIALDGDGDRCVLVDERGEIVDGDAMLTLLALDAKARGRLAGDAIVATVMSNKGLHRALSAAGIGVHTVGVGDRRVVEGLRAHDLKLGGEQSGHVVFCIGDGLGEDGADDGGRNGSAPTAAAHAERPPALIGDGTLTALRVLAALRRRGGTLSALAGAFRAFPQVLVNQPVADKPPFETLPGVLDEVRRIESELGDDGRVLLRYSGTESLARVMVEGPDPERIRALAEGLAGRIADAAAR